MTKLIPMNEKQFANYIDKMVLFYAADIAKSRSTQITDKHILYVQTQITNTLPQGSKTKNHYFFSVINNNKQVGNLWFSVQNSSIAFLHDIVINTEQQKKGYGTEALRQLEQLAREKGCECIALHVFYHNKQALAFHEKNGYITTGVQMYKNI